MFCQEGRAWHFMEGDFTMAGNETGELEMAGDKFGGKSRIKSNCKYFQGLTEGGSYGVLSD